MCSTPFVPYCRIRIGLRYRPEPSLSVWALLEWLPSTRLQWQRLKKTTHTLVINKWNIDSYILKHRPFTDHLRAISVRMAATTLAPSEMCLHASQDRNASAASRAASSLWFAAPHCQTRLRDSMPLWISRHTDRRTLGATYFFSTSMSLPCDFHEMRFQDVFSCIVQGEIMA